MTPLPFTWPHAVAFWAVFVWAHAAEQCFVRRAARRREPTPSGAPSLDAGSMRVILFGTGVATLAAMPLASIAALQMPAAAHSAVFWAGLAMLVGGSLLRRHCWRRLGASFTPEVRAHPDQSIVADGVYAIVRHPSYAGGMAMNAGLGLALGSWASVALLAVASFAAYAYRIAVEERALHAVLGARYRDAMRSRWRLIPFVY